MSSESFRGFPLSRRTFLRGSAAAASIALARPGAARALSKENPDALRVGLIGCGGRGTGAALQAMRAEEGSVLLTAMGDVFQDRIDSSLAGLKNALGEENQDRLQVDPEHCFVGFDAWRKVIDSGVDVVILTTPPHFRPEMLAGAVGAGKHVFAEKPMAVDGPGVRSVLESARLAREKQLAIVSGFCWRYSLPHRAIYQRVLDGALGAIRAIYGTYNTGPNGYKERQPEWSDMESQIRNWFHFLWLSGDYVQEQACHTLDKIAWAMGDVPPLSVTAVGGRELRRHGNNYDHFTATFEYPDEVKAFLMTRQMDGCAFDNNDWIMGEKGVATVKNWGDLFEITGENPWIYEKVEGSNMYQQEHDELFASIRSGKPINDGIWMAHSTLMGVMVRTSAYTGQVVSWEEALNSEERLGPESYALGPVEVREPAVPGRVVAPVPEKAAEEAASEEQEEE
jgi:predicted dehydrogenase